MKKAMFLFLFLVPCVVLGQEMRVVTGRLADTTGQGVKGAIVVLMEKADSVQVQWDYFAADTFRMEYEYREEAALLLYVSAVGYTSKYVEVDREREDQGTIVLEPLSVLLDEAVVAEQQPIGHTYENGKDTYTIPEWLAKREYDLNSLLSLLPSVIYQGNGIAIAGLGEPMILIDDQSPMPGQLENLSPRDIAKVSIIRMPGAKYGAKTAAILNLETVKTWHDYLTMRLIDNFAYSNVTQDNATALLNFQRGKQTHCFSYRYSYSPQKNKEWTSNRTVVPEDSIYYLMQSDKQLDKTSQSHDFSYGPTFQISKLGSLALQYSLNATTSGHDNLTHTYFPNGDETESLSQSLVDGKRLTHTAYLRYSTYFKGKRYQYMTFNMLYFHYKDKKNNEIQEENLFPVSLRGINMTDYQQVYKNKAFVIGLNYKTVLSGKWNMEVGGNFGKLWINNHLLKEGIVSKDDTYNKNASIYMDINQSIERFYYQLGVRGEYGDDRFYFVPSAGMSYRVKDDLNFMLYYRRHVEYPSASDLNANVLYFHKYLYQVGNPDLKPVRIHNLMFRLSLPQNISLVCNYIHRRNTIFPVTMADDRQPKIIKITMENLNKTIDWDIALSWNRTFGLYHLNMNAGGTWYRMDSLWVDDNMKFKPLFYASATHTFSFGAKVKAVLYMYYQTSYDYYNMYVSQMYNLSPYLSISLLKNKLNVQVGGKCLINHGDEYSREQYAHTLSINNTNPHYRTLTIGITYNLNNFIDLFKPNETGEEMIKRAY